MSNETHFFHPFEPAFTRHARQKRREGRWQYAEGNVSVFRDYDQGYYKRQHGAGLVVDQESSDEVVRRVSSRLVEIGRKYGVEIEANGITGLRPHVSLQSADIIDPDINGVMERLNQDPAFSRIAHALVGEQIAFNSVILSGRDIYLNVRHPGPAVQRILDIRSELTGIYEQIEEVTPLPMDLIHMTVGRIRSYTDEQALINMAVDTRLQIETDLRGEPLVVRVGEVLVGRSWDNIEAVRFEDKSPYT